MLVTCPRILIAGGLLTITLTSHTLAAPVPILNAAEDDLLGFPDYEDPAMPGMVFHVTFAVGTFNEVYPSGSLYDGDEAGATAAAGEFVDALNALGSISIVTIGGFIPAGTVVFAAIPFEDDGSFVEMVGPATTDPFVLPPPWFVTSPREGGG